MFDCGLRAHIGILLNSIYLPSLLALCCYYWCCIVSHSLWGCITLNNDFWPNKTSYIHRRRYISTLEKRARRENHKTSTLSYYREVAQCNTHTTLAVGLLHDSACFQISSFSCILVVHGSGNLFHQSWHCSYQIKRWPCMLESHWMECTVPRVDSLSGRRRTGSLKQTWSRPLAPP